MQKNISVILQQIAETESRLSARYLSIRDLSMTERGELCVDGQHLRLQPSAIQQLGRLIGCPTEFLQKVPCDLRACITNRLVKERNRIRRKRFSERLRITVLDEAEVAGISNASLVCLLGTEVLEAAFDVIPKNIGVKLEQLEVRHFKLATNVMELDITTPKASVEMRVGDIVSAGISIYHSPSNAFATQISTYLHRLVCINGLLVPVCQDDKRLKIRRLDRTRFSKREMLENVRHISQIAWEELDFKLQALAELSENRVDPEAVLADLVKRMHLNRKIGWALREALYEDEFGFDASQLGVINALSRVATHYPGLGPVLRRRLMEASGVLSQEQVHRCPVCLSLVYGRGAA